MQAKLTRGFWIGMAGYGLAMALLLIVIRWFELRFFLFDHSTEVYFGIIALIFTSLGMWIAHNLSRPIVKAVEPGAPQQENITVNEKAIEASGLSKRELEILHMMATGLSNQEIADTLFISLSTVKSHVTSIFTKLEVVRRTQAIEKAKSLKIIP